MLAPVYIHRHSIDGIGVRAKQCSVLVSGNIQAAYDTILSANSDGETIRSKPNCSHRSLMLSLHWQCDSVTMCMSCTTPRDPQRRSRLIKTYHEICGVYLTKKHLAVESISRAVSNVCCACLPTSEIQTGPRGAMVLACPDTQTFVLALPHVGKQTTLMITTGCYL